MTLHVRELRVRNYRAFRDARLTFEDVTILVGRNGAGKSTLLDALDFIREALTDSIGVAIERRGGMAGLRHALAGPDEVVEVAVVLDVLWYPGDPSPGFFVGLPGSPAARTRLPLSPIRVLYRFALGGDGAVVREVCLADDSRFPGFRRGRDGYQPIGGAPDFQPGVLDQLLLPLISQHRHTDGTRVTSRASVVQNGVPWGLIHSSLASFRTCRPSVEAVVAGREIGPGDSLETDGRNVADVLHRIRTTWQAPRDARILGAVSVVANGLESIGLVQIAGRRLMEFHQRLGSRVVPFTAAAMSHGTLRALAILVALHQPSQPAIVAIDEIEDSLHLAALQILVAEAVARSEPEPTLPEALPTQVLITTHSTEVLSLPEVIGSRIRIVASRDGEAGVYALAPEAVAALTPPESVGSLLRINALWPTDEPLRNGSDLLALDA